MNDNISFHSVAGRAEVIDRLVHYGGDVHSRDSQGNTPLHLAGKFKTFSSEHL